MTLESIINSWNDYRRALSKQDREIFDAMVNRARMHASASTYAAFSDPVEGVFFSILLEQEKEIRELKKRGQPPLLQGRGLRRANQDQTVD